MNKEKLLELSDTLRGIAEGEEWEREGVVGQGYFSEPCWPNDPMHYIKQGAAIRLKPQPPPPDPYAALKEAHAAGKTIQCKHWSESHWFDLAEPQFTAAPSSYRIKPEPRKVPLGPDDVNVGDQLRFSETGDILADGKHEGSIILSVANFGVLVASCKMGESIGFVEMFTWEQLMLHRIKRSTESEFQPCYKLIEE